MYPWELPLGFQEEFGRDLSGEPPRGTTDQILGFQSMATVYGPEDGYLLTARGNPFGNVVRRGDQVVVHSANGLTFQAPALKSIKANDEWSSQAALSTPTRALRAKVRRRSLRPVILRPNW